MKRANKVHNQNNEGQPPAEFVEKRPKAEGNTGQTTVTDTQGSKEASSALSRVREAAKRDSKLQFSNLLHHVNVDLARLVGRDVSALGKAAQRAAGDERTCAIVGEMMDTMRSAGSSKCPKL